MLGYASWEALALEERADEFLGSSFDEYLAFMGPPSRAAARGNCFGVPEWEMLAQIDSKCVVIVDESGTPLSRHGNPAHERLYLQFVGKHYDLLVPKGNATNADATHAGAVLPHAYIMHACMHAYA